MVTPLFRFVCGTGGDYTGFLAIHGYTLRINYKKDVSDHAEGLPSFLPGCVCFGIVAALDTHGVKEYQGGGIESNMVFSQVLHRFVRVPYDLALFYDYIVLLTGITCQGIFEGFLSGPGVIPCLRARVGLLIPRAAPACLPAWQDRAAHRW
jgi:hypothetical protein